MTPCSALTTCFYLHAAQYYLNHVLYEWDIALALGSARGNILHRVGLMTKPPNHLTAYRLYKGGFDWQPCGNKWLLHGRRSGVSCSGLLLALQALKV